MRSMFSEWYNPDPNEVSTLVKEATVAFDANALLDLYRVSDVQREEIISVLRLIKERVFIPYQVALEYQRNRLGVISAHQKDHESLAADVEKEIDTLRIGVGSTAEAIENSIKKIRDKDIKAELSAELQSAIEAISDRVEVSKNSILNRFAEIKSGHIVEFSEARKLDPVRDELDKILTGRIGPQVDDEELKIRVAEGNRRVKAEVPPGYKDATKPDPTGDYRIWCELIEFAKNSNRDVIFVTNDEKEDWYQIAHGQRIGPRPELKKEMADSANKTYHQTSLFGFLTLAKEHLDAPLSDATIASVSDVRVHANFGGIQTVEGRVLDIRVFVGKNGKLSFIVLVDTEGEVKTINVESVSELERSGILIGDWAVCGTTSTGFEFIVGPIFDVRTGRERVFVPPVHCPECGVVLLQRDDETHALKCPNSKYCPAQSQ